MVALSRSFDQRELILEIEGLEIEIDTGSGPLHAVRGVDLKIHRGEIVCVVGESGCGKSLTSLAIMDLLPPSVRRRAVKLHFRGEELTELGEKGMSDLRGNKLSMIFQDPMTSLNPIFRIGDQLVEVVLRHRNMSRREALDRARELLELVGITATEERLRQYPHQLSGGLRQRVMIAMALMCEPDLLIADEPTTALDVTVQAQILNLLKSLQERLGVAVLFISHDLGVVARLADRVAVMYTGQIVEEGPAKSVFAHPSHPYTRGLLDCIPVPGRTARDQPLSIIRGMVPNLVGGLAGCGFRDRCDFAREACKLDVNMRRRGDGHVFRCILDPDTEPRPTAHPSDAGVNP